MDEKEKERLSLVIYDVVWSIKNTLSLPVHDTLYKSFLFSLLMLGIGLIGAIGGFYIFISWQGSLICSVVLGVLLWVERAQNNAYERTYKIARAKMKEAQKRVQQLQNRGGAKSAVPGVSHDDSISVEQVGGQFEETSSG